jgi:small subunit ribosomal protein S4e
MHKTRHLGGFDIVSLRDSKGHNFATRVNNVYVIGKNAQTSITLPRRDGAAISIIEEQKERENASK